jgi:cellobiose-specific phosphotransferase system component IIC
MATDPSKGRQTGMNYKQITLQTTLIQRLIFGIGGDLIFFFFAVFSQNLLFIAGIVGNTIIWWILVDLNEHYENKIMVSERKQS